jgi:hypothetical protein
MGRGALAQLTLDEGEFDFFEFDQSIVKEN